MSEEMRFEGEEMTVTAVEDGLGEHARVKIGSHLAIISPTDDGVKIYLSDHLTIDVSGERKKHPVVTVGDDEFSTYVKFSENEGSFTGIGSNSEED